MHSCAPVFRNSRDAPARACPPLPTPQARPHAGQGRPRPRLSLRTESRAKVTMGSCSRGRGEGRAREDAGHSRQRRLWSQEVRTLATSTPGTGLGYAGRATQGSGASRARPASRERVTKRVSEDTARRPRAPRSSRHLTRLVPSNRGRWDTERLVPCLWLTVWCGQRAQVTRRGHQFSGPGSSTRSPLEPGSRDTQTPECPPKLPRGRCHQVRHPGLGPMAVGHLGSTVLPVNGGQRGPRRIFLAFLES